MLSSTIKQKINIGTGVTEYYYPAIANTDSLVAMANNPTLQNKLTGLITKDKCKANRLKLLDFF